MKQKQTNQVIGNQNKEKMEKVALGVAKPNKSFSRTNQNQNLSEEQIEQNMFDFLEGK